MIDHGTNHGTLVSILSQQLCSYPLQQLQRLLPLGDFVAAADRRVHSDDLRQAVPMNMDVTRYGHGYPKYAKTS